MELPIIVSIISALAAITTIVMSIRTMAKEKASRATELALLNAAIGEYKKSLDHAHDKIRDLYAKSNDTNIVIGRIQVTLEENTRVLRKVEDALMLIAKIEQKIESHIDAEAK